MKVEIGLSLELMERSRELVESLFLELGRLTLNTVLEASAEQLAGPRRPGDRSKSGPTRHGYDSGSLRFGAKKVSVEKPRLRLAGKEVQVPLYERLRRDPALPGKVFEASANGLATRRVEPVLEAAGLKKSQVSRHLVSEMEGRYEALMSRKIESRMLVVMLDGIHVAEHVILTAVGVDEVGIKHVLGIREGASENAEVCKSLLGDLIERGLNADLGILFVLDGPVGFAQGGQRAFSSRPHSKMQGSQASKRSRPRSRKQEEVRSRGHACRLEAPLQRGGDTHGGSCQGTRSRSSSRGRLFERGSHRNFHGGTTRSASAARSQSFFDEHHRKLSRSHRTNHETRHQRPERNHGPQMDRLGPLRGRTQHENH